MTSLTPYRSPSAVDRLAEDLFSPVSLTSWSSGFPLEAWEEEGAFVVRAAVPGIDSKDLEVAIANSALEIRAERKHDKERKDRRAYVREISYGRLASSVSLPFPVDADKAKADYTNGVLTIRLPQSEAMKPKKIKVHGKGLPLVGKLLGR